MEIEGFGSANFASVEGLGFTHRTQEYMSGGDYRVKELYLGTKYNDVTLRRGLSNSNQLLQFAEAPKKTYQNAHKSEVPGFKTDVTIKQLDNAGVVVKKWVLQDAWVKSFSLSDLDASKSELSFESIVLSHSGLKLESPGLLDTVLNGGRGFNLF